MKERSGNVRNAGAPTAAGLNFSRFQGRHGRRHLIEAIRQQTLVSGDTTLATSISKCGSLEEYQPNDVITSQGDSDNDIFFLISGEVSIKVNGRMVATRSAGTHVGEMSLIDRLTKRSATVAATERTTVVRLPEHHFSKLAVVNPELWRRVAVEVAKRLRERNKLLRQPHNKAVVFIGSSTEALPVANEIHRRLSQKPVVARLWSEGVFQASYTSIENLVRLAQDADFAVLVLTKDDLTVSRGQRRPSPRDNVVFELGLFMGALGRDRVFLVKPKDAELRIPSDLLGVTCLSYAKAGPTSLRSRMLPTCRQIADAIQRAGPR